MDLLIAPNSVPLGNADTAPISGTPQWATSGNPATNTPATVLPAYAFNAIQAELTAAIQGAGITLDRTKLTQLAAAIQKMTQGASAITAPDTGTVNAYAITLTPAPLALAPGMMVAIDNIVASNTGASTLNVNGLGALPIQSAGGVALQGGELVATYGALLRLNHGGTAWTLLQTTGGSLPVKAATKSEHAVNLGQFLAQFTSSGYVKLPNGLILQWGFTPSLSTTADTTVVLPIAFPNNALQVIVSSGYTAGSGYVAYAAASFNGLTSFTTRSGGTTGQGSAFFAIGN